MAEQLTPSVSDPSGSGGVGLSPRPLSTTDSASMTFGDLLDDDILGGEGDIKDDHSFEGMRITFDLERRCRNWRDLLASQCSSCLDALMVTKDESARRELLESGKLFEMVMDIKTVKKLAGISTTKETTKQHKSDSESRRRDREILDGDSIGELSAVSAAGMSSSASFSHALSSTDVLMIEEETIIEDDEISKLPFAKHKQQKSPLYEAFFDLFLACDEGRSLGNLSVLNRQINEIVARYVDVYESTSFVPLLYHTLRCIINLEAFPKGSHWALVFFNEDRHFCVRDSDTALVDFQRMLKQMGLSENTQGESALDYAIRSGKSEFIRACLEHRKREETIGGSIEQDRLVSDTTHWVELNKSFVQDYILTSESGKQCLATLRSALIRWIQAGRPLSALDILGAVWHDPDGEGELWSTLIDRLKSILKYQTLHQSKVDWQWLKTELLNHPLFVSNPDKLKELESLISNEDSVEKGSEIEKGFRRLISDCHCWNDLCEFGLNENPLVKLGLVSDVVSDLNVENIKLRQDMLEYGVKSTKSELELSEINIQSSSFDYDCLQEWDLQAYVSEVVCVAHQLNPLFSEVTSFLKDYGPVRIGPVKSSERIRAKALSDYSDKSKGYSYPFSAHVVDLVRCSVTVSSLDDLYDACHKFVDECEQSKNIDILRLKNGFNKYWVDLSSLDSSISSISREDLVKIPNQYCDIKFNVAITDHSLKLSIIGEVQLLLDVILESKLKGHELYEISRNIPFLQRCVQQYSSESFGTWLLRGGAHPRYLTPLLVAFPHQFTVKNLSMVISKSSGLTGFSLIAKNSWALKGQLLERLLFLINLNSTKEELNSVFDEGGPSRWWVPFLSGDVSSQWIEGLHFFDCNLSQISSIDDGKSSIKKRMIELPFGVELYRRIHMLSLYIELTPELSLKALRCMLPRFDDIRDAVLFWIKPNVCDTFADRLQRGTFLDPRCALNRECAGNLILSNIEGVKKMKPEQLFGLFGYDPKLTCIVWSVFMATSITSVRSLKARMENASQHSRVGSVGLSSTVVSQEKMRFYVNLYEESGMLEMLPKIDNGLYFRQGPLFQHSLAHSMIARYLHSMDLSQISPDTMDDAADDDDDADSLNIHARYISKLIPKKFDDEHIEEVFWTLRFDFEYHTGNLFDLFIHECSYSIRATDRLFQSILPKKLWDHHKAVAMGHVIPAGLAPSSVVSSGIGGSGGSTFTKCSRGTVTEEYGGSSLLKIEEEEKEEKQKVEVMIQSEDAEAEPEQQPTEPVPSPVYSEQRRKKIIKKSETEVDTAPSSASAYLSTLDSLPTYGGKVELKLLHQKGVKQKFEGFYLKLQMGMPLQIYRIPSRADKPSDAAKPKFRIPLERIVHVMPDSRSKTKFQIKWRPEDRVKRVKKRSIYVDAPKIALEKTCVFRVSSAELQAYWIEGIRSHMLAK